MSEKVPASAAGRFRPFSWDDFKTYASNLSWLLELPVQRGQELLARIYGYANAHEVQQALKRPGSAGWEGDGDGMRGFGIMTSMENRMLHLIAGELGLGSLAGVSQRGWKSRECEFFSAPGQHRAAFRRQRMAILAGEGKGVAGMDLKATDYAEVADDRGEPGKVYLKFTPNGQAVYDALGDLMPDRFAGDGQRWQQQMTEVERMAERYPENAWVHAALVYAFSDYYFQGDWSLNLGTKRGRGYVDLDADPGFEQYACVNADLFLDHAKKAVALFEEMLEGKGARMADEKASFSGGDSFYYPAILYQGACVAINAGETKLAMKWLQKAWQITEGDSFGVRYPLSALYLNAGRAYGSIKKMFGPATQVEPWGWLCTAAAAAAQGNKAQAIEHATRTLLHAWAPIELFAGRWQVARAQTEIGSNHETPAFFQQLWSMSQEFWERERAVRGFFVDLSEDAAVRRMVLDMHKARTATRGSAFMAMAEATKREHQLMLQAERFDKEMPMRLGEIWDARMVGSRASVAEASDEQRARDGDLAG